jgi:hypothetical protein
MSWFAVFPFGPSGAFIPVAALIFPLPCGVSFVLYPAGDMLHERPMHLIWHGPHARTSASTFWSMALVNRYQLSAEGPTVERCVCNHQSL